MTGFNNVSFPFFNFRFFLSSRRPGQPPGPLDWSRLRPEKEEALLQIPDPGARKRISLQRLRVQAEALGAGPKPEPDGAPDQNLVPEPADEEQEEQPKTTGIRRRRRWTQQLLAL